MSSQFSYQWQLKSQAIFEYDCVDTYLENGTFVVQIVTCSGCRKLPIGSAVFKFEHLFIFLAKGTP